MSLLKKIKQAFKTLVKGDSTAYPQAQVGYNGKVTDVIRLSVYGVCGNAPVNSHVLLIGSQGMESTKFAIENDFLNRLKGLKAGEVALYNSVTKSFVFLKENGDVDITATGKVNIVAPAEINLTAPTVTVDGDLIVTGDVTAAGTIEGNELTNGSVPYSTHVHSDPQGGNTGVPQ